MKILKKNIFVNLLINKRLILECLLKGWIMFKNTIMEITTYFGRPNYYTKFKKIFGGYFVKKIWYTNIDEISGTCWLHGHEEKRRSF